MDLETCPFQTKPKQAELQLLYFVLGVMTLLILVTKYLLPAHFKILQAMLLIVQIF